MILFKHWNRNIWLYVEFWGGIWNLFKRLVRLQRFLSKKFACHDGQKSDETGTQHLQIRCGFEIGIFFSKSESFLIWLFSKHHNYLCQVLSNSWRFIALLRTMYSDAWTKNQWRMTFLYIHIFDSRWTFSHQFLNFDVERLKKFLHRCFGRLWRFIKLHL